MDRLQRLRYVTERYEQLQGLRLVPLGIPFLFSAAWRGGQLAWAPGTSGVGAHIWFVSLITAAIGLSLMARSYYRRRFGNVQSAATIKTPLAAFVFAAMFVLAVSVPTDSSSIAVPAVILSFGLGYVGLVGGVARPHYLAIAGFVALFATLGPLGVPLHTRDVLCDQLLGIGFIVVGVGDHLLLRDTLVPVTRVNAV
jgi:hypothetical protein